MMYRYFILSLFLVVTPTIYALNLGVHGQVYPVIETDFLTFVENRYHELQASGEWAQQQKKWQQHMREMINRPKSLHLPTTQIAKSFTFDPTIEVQHDILAANGQVVVKAGTTVNPLKIMPLTKVLLFLNADDEKQMAWALRQDLTYARTKWILVGSAISETAKKAKHLVYFDQMGKLTQHFYIQHVPALVKQEGDLLKIEECVV